jgi:ribonuclease BN (tRNA processing enzyme)
VPDVEITFIGSGDAFGSGGRFQTCIRVRADGATALVDCGATSLTAMRAQGVDPSSIETVVITHLQATTSAGCRSSSSTASSPGGPRRSPCSAR